MELLCVTIQLKLIKQHSKFSNLQICGRNTGEPPPTATSLQRPPVLVPVESTYYIHFNFNPLQWQWPLKLIPN